MIKINREAVFMKQEVTLGKTDIKVFPIGFGANAVGGHNLYPDLDEEQNKDLVRFTIDSGINFIDTAYAYGHGRSEELIGEVLKEYNREEIMIATKAAHSTDEKGNKIYDNSPEFLKQSVYDALERLQTDYIDLFYIHFPDENTPKNEAVAALGELKEAGKIRSIGVSNFSLEQLKEANEDDLVDVVQDHYNLLEREAENDLLKYTVANNITFVPFFPLASGLLTGKYDEEVTFPKEDLRSKQENFKGEKFKENIRKVNQLQPIADKHGVEIVHVVLNWYLTQPSVDVLIPGAKNKEQLKSNMRTVEFDLTEAEIKQIDQIFK